MQNPKVGLFDVKLLVRLKKYIYILSWFNREQVPNNSKQENQIMQSVSYLKAGGSVDLNILDSGPCDQSDQLDRSMRAVVLEFPSFIKATPGFTLNLFPKFNFM